MPQQQVYPMKRGDTISLAGTLDLPAGTGVVWTGEAQVRQPGGALVDTFDVTIQPPVAPATLFQILAVMDSSKTAVWPMGNLLCDFRFRDNSTPPVVITSPTFTIACDREESA